MSVVPSYPLTCTVARRLCALATSLQPHHVAELEKRSYELTCRSDQKREMQGVVELTCQQGEVFADIFSPTAGPATVLPNPRPRTKNAKQIQPSRQQELLVFRLQGVNAQIPAATEAYLVRLWGKMCHPDRGKDLLVNTLSERWGSLLRAWILDIDHRHTGKAPCLSALSSWLWAPRPMAPVKAPGCPGGD